MVEDSQTEYDENKESDTKDSVSANFFLPSNRKMIIDRWVKEINSGESFENSYFLRLNSKQVEFKEINFRYSIFEHVYFRKGKFIDCNFTGCKFIDCNFNGATFNNCTFDYACFEKTLITSDILFNECRPYRVNLQSYFARSLRMNYQQIGDVDSYNKALQVELEAEGKHLHNTWLSKENYYRNKYTGLLRLVYFFKWTRFKFLDFIWGHGESFLKLFRSTVLIIASMTLYTIYLQHKTDNQISITTSFLEACGLFFGVSDNTSTASVYVVIISILRIIITGFFITVLVRKLGRR